MPEPKNYFESDGWIVELFDSRPSVRLAETSLFVD